MFLLAKCKLNVRDAWKDKVELRDDGAFNESPSINIYFEYSFVLSLFIFCKSESTSESGNLRSVKVTNLTRRRVKRRRALYCLRGRDANKKWESRNSMNLNDSKPSLMCRYLVVDPVKRVRAYIKYVYARRISNCRKSFLAIPDARLRPCFASRARARELHKFFAKLVQHAFAATKHGHARADVTGRVL